MNDNIELILNCMASRTDMRDIQRVQTEHRMKLVNFWGIHDGSKVLEIGCGQGDTTAVLAYYVGEKGFVQGIDIGSPTYGSPISVGDSANFLMNSALGKQIKMDYEVDILLPEIDFPEKFFDYVVFSHSSWYLGSSNELRKMLSKVRKWGNQLCFAEWNANIQTIEQYPHLLSILIQAQYETFKQSSESNVRTLFIPNDLKSIAEEVGWSVLKEETIHSPKLQDAQWEIDKVLSDIDVELKEVENIPKKLVGLIQSQVKLLENSIATSDTKPLSVYAFIAR
ncbi:class I SAM-dependent methyltransferase [Bacillus suaedaesalsae]|uniref:Class I SAM-dependent methyltransferase n=1 Tax=Bacillus suaedaesalsae TaxID=2810349 RepID=A0ABS2DHA4_9BACI|nr:class I SAM-dependent methyltransferase [Bacillus suaedaesalsae]MBM6617852.1 class I SAM-dependent methyltransferase [Bacillus suaedaesalsae]